MTAESLPQMQPQSAGESSTFTGNGSSSAAAASSRPEIAAGYGSTGGEVQSQASRASGLGLQAATAPGVIAGGGSGAAADAADSLQQPGGASEGDGYGRRFSDAVNDGAGGGGTAGGSEQKFMRTFERSEQGGTAAGFLDRMRGAAAGAADDRDGSGAAGCGLQQGDGRGPWQADTASGDSGEGQADLTDTYMTGIGLDASKLPASTSTSTSKSGRLPGRQQGMHPLYREVLASKDAVLTAVAAQEGRIGSAPRETDASSQGGSIGLLAALKKAAGQDAPSAAAAPSQSHAIGGGDASGRGGAGHEDRRGCACDALMDPCAPGTFDDIWLATARNNTRIFDTVFPGTMQVGDL